MIVICSVQDLIYIHVPCNLYVSLYVLGYFSAQHDNEKREQQYQPLNNLSEYVVAMVNKSLGTFYLNGHMPVKPGQRS